ncbi:hypothetical protein NST97_14410 [Aeribacillus sp. FSL K6-1305]|uniref:hypothetical protein n=1 Tax=Aeribacillus sp. FSL K6-1305 TaxID=2954569 RepID=UPI0030FD53D8
MNKNYSSLSFHLVHFLPCFMGICKNKDQNRGESKNVVRISLAEQSAAGIEQTSAASEQTNSSMEDISVNSMKLANLSEELNGFVQQFKLSN